VSALLWPLFEWSALPQPATMLAGTTGEGDVIASSLGRRGISKLLWWRARMLRALFWPLFARSAWAQPAIVVADTTVEGIILASARSVGVDSTSHCVSGLDW
jgi:hypothetical protein